MILNSTSTTQTAALNWKEEELNWKGAAPTAGAPNTGAHEAVGATEGTPKVKADAFADGAMFSVPF